MLVILANTSGEGRQSWGTSSSSSSSSSLALPFFEAEDLRMAGGFGRDLPDEEGERTDEEDRGRLEESVEAMRFSLSREVADFLTMPPL